MKKLMFLLVLAVLSSTSFAVVLVDDNFDGPTMVNWVEYIPGAYNGAGQYTMDGGDFATAGAADYIYRTMWYGNAYGTGTNDFTVNLDMANIDLQAGTVEGETWFNYQWYDGTSRLVLTLYDDPDDVAEDGADQTYLIAGGDLGDGAGYIELARTVISTSVTDMDVELVWDDSAGNLSVDFSVNGGAMTNLITQGGYAPGAAANYGVEYFYMGALSADAFSTVDLDHYTMTDVPEPATLALLGLGGLVLRRRK